MELYKESNINGKDEFLSATLIQKLFELTSHRNFRTALAQKLVSTLHG